MAGGGPKATPEGPPAGLGPRTGGATAAGGLVATAVGGLEVDPGDSRPRAASGGHGARVPSGGRRAANVQMGVVLCGERRTWSRERRDYGSGGLAEFGLWRRVWDRVGVVAAGGFTFRLFLFFFTLFSILYRAKAGANDENRARRIHSCACVVFSVS